jgi:hypothetical protein
LIRRSIDAALSWAALTWSGTMDHVHIDEKASSD